MLTSQGHRWALCHGRPLPGLLMAGAMMVIVYWISVRRNYPRDDKINLHEIFVKLKSSFWALMTPVILLGSIYGGICTPTEAAAISTTYILIVELFVYKDLQLAEIPRISCRNSGSDRGHYAYFRLGFHVRLDPGTGRHTRLITTAVLNFSDNKTFLLLGMLLLIIVGGCFMEGVSLMIILLPVFLPIVNKIGIDLVHFGYF